MSRFFHILYFNRPVADSQPAMISDWFWRSSSIRCSIFMWQFVSHWVPCKCRGLAHTNIKALYLSAKATIARVLRLINLLSLSIVLLVQNLVQCWLGKSIYISVCSILSFTFLAVEVKFILRSLLAACSLYPLQMPCTLGHE